MALAQKFRPGVLRFFGRLLLEKWRCYENIRLKPALAVPSRLTYAAGNSKVSNACQTDPSRAARGRGDPHLPRGGGDLRQAGDALFDRQGFVGAAASGDEGVLSGQAAVPVPACRHDLEVPRDDRVSRRDGDEARPRPARPHQRGRRARRHQPVRPRLERPHPRHEDRRRCARRSTSTASTRPSAARGATRRSPAPRSASFPSATPSMPGTRRTSGRNCGTSTTRASRRANRSASSRCRTGPNSTSGSTSCRKTSRSCRSISPSSGRSSSATAC